MQDGIVFCPDSANKPACILYKQDKILDSPCCGCYYIKIEIGYFLQSVTAYERDFICFSGAA